MIVHQLTIAAEQEGRLCVARSGLQTHERAATASTWPYRSSTAGSVCAA